MPYRQITARGVTLLCFPAHDTAFVTLAVRHLRAMDGIDPDGLTSLLVPMYPRVIVRPREPLAALAGGAAWYVYRDGRYSPFAEDASRWWESAGCARLVIDAATGRYVDANDAALELTCMDRATLLAVRSGDLTDPRAAVNVPWIWELLREVGELHSTSILRTPDGRTIPVEYHLVRDGDGPGRAASYLREVPPEAAEASARDEPVAEAATGRQT